MALALVKDHHQTPSPSVSFYENMLAPVEPSVDFPHIIVSPYEFDRQPENGGLESPNSNNNMVINKNNNSRVISTSPTISSSSSANYEAHNNEEFKPGFGCFLSFINDDQNMSHPHQMDPIWETSSCSSKNNYHDDWLYSDAMVVDPSQDSPTQPTCFNNTPRRQIMEEEENMHSPNKKQCTAIGSKKPANTTSKSKSKSGSTSKKDPQSVVAKNRRERISEKLKILQDLVPNGSKVDLVTMLEKAIGYVKFLQLQMKGKIHDLRKLGTICMNMPSYFIVLATDEFWPVAGGKAPDITQVKEAIDAILSSQRSGPSN